MYLDDIQISMERIIEYSDEFSFDLFKKNYKTVDAVIRNFEIIGEASKNLPETIKEKYPYFPWKEMYYLRNKISHEYFGIDYETIWDIIINNIPKNLIEIEEIIKNESK